MKIFNNNKINNTPKKEVYQFTKDNSIDYFEIINFLIDHKKTIYNTVIAFFCIGIIIAFTTPTTYKTKSTLIIEDNSAISSNSDLLKQIKNFSGIGGNLQNNMSIITIDFYPSIVYSKTFLINLLNDSVYSSKVGRSLKIFDYIENYRPKNIFEYIYEYTFGIPQKISQYFTKEKDFQFSKQGVIKITKKQEKAIKYLTKRIDVELTDQPVTLEIETEMPEAFMTAQFNNLIIKHLTDDVIKFKTIKAKDDFLFTQLQYDQSKEDFSLAQNRLAEYRDANINSITSKAKAIEDRLLTEYNIKFNLYNTIAQQLEQAKINLQENTPIFETLTPPILPNERSSPKRGITLLIMIFGGFIAGCLISVIKYQISRNIGKINLWQTETPIA